MRRKIVRVVRKLGDHMEPAKVFLECGHVIKFDGYWNRNRYAECFECARVAERHTRSA